MTTNFTKSAYSPLKFVAMSFQNGLQYRSLVLERSSAMIWLHRVKIWWTSVQ